MPGERVRDKFAHRAFKGEPQKNPQHEPAMNGQIGQGSAATAYPCVHAVEASRHNLAVTRPPHGEAQQEASVTTGALASCFCRRACRMISLSVPMFTGRAMQAALDSAPPLLAVPANPVPQGARAGYFRTSDRVRLRYCIWPKASRGKGTVCLVHGRTEFIEKYFETVSDFQKRGFAVATFDWRGQGGSDRLIKSRKLGYVDRFDDYWIDLKSFYTEILLPDCPPPFYLVGHSMGGLACLYAGGRDRLMFDRMFLSAPMVSLPDQPLSIAGMARLAEGLSFLGLGQLPIGRRQDKPLGETTFAGNPLTSDLKRYLRTVETVKAMPDLEVTLPTIRWAAAAFGAMARTASTAFPASIRIPTLMLAAANDAVVSTPAIEELGVRMRSGRHVIIGNARHELFMENDAIRGQVFAAFDAFITEQSEH